MIVFLFTLGGCHGGQPHARLEAFEASNDQAPHPHEGSMAAGLASVSGADRDWTLTLAAPDGGLATVTVHAPGRSDLSMLDGHELGVKLGGAWGADTRDLEIDDDGVAVFYGQPFIEYGPASDAFGADLVAFGDETGTGSISDDYGDYEVSFRTAVFQTDDGAVEVNPAEPFLATIEGGTWRVVVHASFTVTKFPDAMSDCGGATFTTLSFEMVRDQTPELEPVAPQPGGLFAGQIPCE